MRISENGLKIIKEFEGFRSRPYRDKVGIPTIGYGFTHYTGGRVVMMDDPEITEHQATLLLEDEINRIYAKYVNAYVQVPLTQNQFDALVSFTYNEGAGNLRRSTLLRRINNNDYAGAADEFLKWDRAGGHILKGLDDRRYAERALFLS
jgi:lysozyme